MTDIIFFAVAAVMTSLLVAGANLRDALYQRKHCQVCAGNGSVVLTDLTESRHLCLRHRHLAARIHRLESELYNDERE